MANNNFDALFNAAELAKDAEEIEKNGGGDFKEVPHGDYEVHIDNIEIKEAKSSGNPMMSIWFKVLDGDYKNQRIFYNQVLYSEKAQNPGFGIFMAKKFLRSLESGVEVEFESFEQFENLCMEIAEACEKFDFQLSYTEGKKGYSEYEIVKQMPALG